MTRNLNRLLILSGIAGMLLFASTIILLSMLYPNYNHLTQYMSELGAVGSPVMFEMNVFGFMISGSLLSLFSIGMYLRSKNKLQKMGSISLFIGSLVVVLLAFLPCDLGCQRLSLTGIVHEKSSIAPIVAVISSLLFFAIGSKGDKMFRDIRQHLIAISVLSAIFGFVYLNIPTPYPGLLQRVAVVLPFTMLFVIAIKTFNEVRLNGKNS